METRKTGLRRKKNEKKMSRLKSLKDSNSQELRQRLTMLIHDGFTVLHRRNSRVFHFRESKSDIRNISVKAEDSTHW